MRHKVPCLILRNCASYNKYDIRFFFHFSGKTFTLLSDDGITTRVVQHCFEKIDSDEIHTYKVSLALSSYYLVSPTSPLIPSPPMNTSSSRWPIRPALDPTFCGVKRLSPVLYCYSSLDGKLVHHKVPPPPTSQHYNRRYPIHTWVKRNNVA